MPDKAETKKSRATPHSLPYRIELWKDGKPQIIAMAESITLARAIFTAALREHPRERLMLVKGNSVLSEQHQAVGKRSK